MEQNKLKLPKFKLNSNLLRLHYSYETLLHDIVEELKKIPSLDRLRMNPELTKMVCQVIEEVSLAKPIKGKIDKKTLVIEVFSKLFDLTEDEQKLMSNDIDFCCNNNLIKRRSICEKMFGFFF